MQVNYISYAFGGEILHNFGQIQRGRLRRPGAGATGNQKDQEPRWNCGKPSHGAETAEDGEKRH
jgi:hypothetical protein